MIFYDFLIDLIIMTNICILICGKMRSIDIVIHTFNKLLEKSEYKCKYYICTEFNNDETEYLNNTAINDIVKCNVEKITLVNRVDNCFRNSLNYSNKLSCGIQSINENYNLYIVCRSDFIIFDVITVIEQILTNTNNENYIYCSNSINNRISDENQLCEHVLICKNYNTLKQLQNMYHSALENKNYIENILFNYAKCNNIMFSKIDIKYKLLLSKCNIISISGDSGSGKSTLLDKLEILFNVNSILKLETDRYHKWERGDLNYLQISHLNPNANYIEKMYDDTYNLKIGNDIHAVDYDHVTGKFTQINKIKTKANVILCGLHTLYDDKLNNIIDVKIFMDTDRELVTKWKIDRDVRQRGHTIEHVKKQIQNRENDYKLYIETQKLNADICINFYGIEKIKCKFVVKNCSMIHKLLKNCVNYYCINKINDDISIELLGCINNDLKNEIISQINNANVANIVLNNDFFGEIQLLLLILIYV